MNKVKFYRVSKGNFVETATIRITQRNKALYDMKRTTPTIAEATAHMAKRGYQRGKP